MKKLNYLILGATALTLASCSQEDLISHAGTGDGNVEFNIILPNTIGTRANVTELGTGFNANELVIAVYENKDTQGSTSTPNLGTPSFVSTADFAFTTNNNSGDLSTKVNLNLVAGKSYYVAFFAASSASLHGDKPVYVFDADTHQLTVNYDNMTPEGNNANAYECFYKLFNTQKITAGGNSFDVVLTRPVAQINWGTSENLTATNNSLYQEIINTFGADGEYIVTNTKLTNVPNLMNLADMSVSGQADIEFDGYTAPWGATYPVQPGTYNYVAMQYVLAAQTSATSNLTLTINNSKNTTATQVTNDIVVASAPFQANYRTNIYGNLLSSNAEFNVTKQDFFAGEYNTEVGGASVSVVDGKVTCLTPNLPAGVTPQEMEAQGAAAVAIGPDGQPVYIKSTINDLSDAMTKYPEIYFAPNATIPTRSHGLQVVNTNTDITIHGNGATLAGTGSERDISIQWFSAIPGSDLSGKTVNVTVNNLNNVKVWGAQQKETEFTANIYMNNCTMNGSGITDTTSMIMTRGDDDYKGTVNWYINGCQVNNVQCAMHSTYPGTIEISNCKFNEVGIPLNYAKKAVAYSQVTVADCVFIKCGIIEGVTAWDYSAPIRVVDFEGPQDSLTLLVDGCTFIDTISQWDILLWDYRTDKSRTSYPVDLTVKNCTPVNPTINTITVPTTTEKIP